MIWQITQITTTRFFFDHTLVIQNFFGTDFIQNIPEIFLMFTLFVGLIIVGTSNFAPAVKNKKEITTTLCELVRVSLAIAFGFYLLQIFFFLYRPTISFNGMSIVDFYTQGFKLLIVVIMCVLLTASQNYIDKHRRHLMEYPLLFLLTTIFLLLLVSSYNLMTLFLSLIGFSLNVYVLLLYDSFNHASREAGIKYFYLSSFSSGLIISGIFFAYLIFHNLNFLSIAWILHHWSLSPNIGLHTMLIYVMLFFLLLGFLFKLAAFPCHLWAPEVYDGSPHPITALFILPIKVATFGIFLRLLNYTFADLYFVWSYIIWMSAFFSMIWGCFGALGEQLIKRFLAYSSINQMGFLFMGLACGTFEGLRASLLYLLLYILMNLGFFIFFLNTNEIQTHRAMLYLTDFNDYVRDNYLYSVTLVIIFFSMAGIPPLGGFFGKYFLFWHSFETGHYLLVITGMITSLIATYYYLRVIKIMWFEQPRPGIPFQFETSLTETLFAIYILCEFILVWFLIWNPWIFPFLNTMTAACINPLTYTFHI
jgi:NADH-quinone oxidoreductase subunit N